MLNAVRFGAKRKVKCCKMRGDKHKYSLKRYRQKLFKPLKTWPKRAKHPSKSGVLGAKSGENGLEKMRAGNQTRKAIWCKMQAILSKIDKTKDVKG